MNKLRPGLSGMLIAALATLTLQSCGLVKTELDKCREQREYQQARPGQPISVPDGLKAPSKAALLPAPEGPVRTMPLPETEPCLIEPPDYRSES